MALISFKLCFFFIIFSGCFSLISGCSITMQERGGKFVRFNLNCNLTFSGKDNTLLFNIARDPEEKRFVLSVLFDNC